jgi:hypothetical protein
MVLKRKNKIRTQLQVNGLEPTERELDLMPTQEKNRLSRRRKVLITGQNVDL